MKITRESTPKMNGEVDDDAVKEIKTSRLFEHSNGNLGNPYNKHRPTRVPKPKLAPLMIPVTDPQDKRATTDFDKTLTNFNSMNTSQDMSTNPLISKKFSI